MSNLTSGDFWEGNWKEIKGEAQKLWGKITDDEWEQAKGNRTKLEGAIQKNYAITKEEAKQKLDEFEKKHRK